MRDLRGGDSINDGGIGMYGGGAWWGFAFIVFIIFAIIIAFAWLRGDRRDGGWEHFLPLLGILKGKFGGDDHCELVKDQAKDTGLIIANNDQNTYKLERRIDAVEDAQKTDTIASLRQALSDEKTFNHIGYSYNDLKREIQGIREHFKPGWAFEPVLEGCRK